MKASLGLLFLGTAALAASSVAQSAQNGTAGSASAQTSLPARRSSAQDQVSASTSGAIKVSSKTGKVASSSPLKSGTTIQAELVKPIDAKKSKVGDEVIAKTTEDVKSGGKVVVPTGSTLVGRIMGVRLQNSEQTTSQVGIAFNRAVLKSGKEIPVALGIQAIGSSQPAVTAAASARTGAVLRETASSTRPAVVNTSAHHTGTVANTADHPGTAVNTSLPANTQGVVGLPGLSLFSQTTTFATASVISSQDNNVHLDSGTEMILRVNK
jgi:poly-gamma-glutamate capsule biosynthesis protein CapA/YwtB (metallophosphatase superfamily)